MQKAPGKTPHGPGQKAGETFSEFFARRRRQGELRRTNATEKELADYTKRVEKAATFCRPTRPTSVFLWKIAGDDDGDLPEAEYWMDVRVVVGRKSIGEMWPLYPNSHKVYDAWCDEWDICPKLSPEEEMIEEDDCFYEEENVADPVPLGGGLVHQANFYETELGLYYDDEDSSGFKPALEAFRPLVRYHHGLTPVTAEVAGITSCHLPEAKIQRIFGLLRETMDNDTWNILPSVSGFVTAMLANPGDAQAPGVLWDL